VSVVGVGRKRHRGRVSSTEMEAAPWKR
jgi:hypothetical protein